MTPASVAYSWLGGYFPHTPDEYEAYEAAAHAMAANGKAVWQCYVAGMDPTDAAAALKVGIEFEDGEAVVTFDPPRPAYPPAEWYHVLGKTNLADKAWSEREAGHRFFMGRIVVPESVGSGQ